MHMPVPKGKKKVFGIIVGANINRGKSLAQAKTIADKAIKHKGVNDKKVKKYKSK
jgi:hypothetical protein